MDSGSGSNNEGRDLALKYCTPIEGNRNDTICNFCGMVIKSGGITRFKFHLSHTDPHSNSKKCPNVPPKVKKEIRQLLVEMHKAKAKKTANIEEIRAELRGTMGGSYRCIIICDGWTGPTKLSIINFMVYCKGSIIFLKFVDASNNIKDNKYIYGLLKDVIKKVGKANVV